MKKTLLFFSIAIMPFLYLGCARVSVSNENEPVFVEVNEPNQTESLFEAESNNQLDVNSAADTNVSSVTSEGVPVGFTEDGFPFIGFQDAPVTLEEYSDFLCPFCLRHFQQTWPTIFDQYVKSGQVLYVFRDMPLESLHPTADTGHIAARCAADQGVAYFWKMHDQLFASQNQWNQIPDPTEYLSSVAENIDLDMQQYQACMSGGEKAVQVSDSVDAGRALGFNGTPSFQFIQNENVKTYFLIGAQPVGTFTQWLDALLAGEAPAQETPAEQEPPELPFWANEEGLAPDPDRPGFTMAGDPYKGNIEAALVVIEFTDFQCPACAQHALEIQPVLDETFVDSGEIMWVFKNLPLGEHPHAPAAAVAAECAGEQNAFWEMHHRLFETQDEWSAEDNVDQIFLAEAEALGLDMTAFSTCFDSRLALERVLRDIYDSQGLVETTPNFVILYGGQGRVLRSSRPTDQFINLLSELLEEAEQAELENAQP